MGQNPDHLVAAARASGAPADAAEELARLNRAIVFDQEQAKSGEWARLESLGSAYEARARLTGSYDDYARAGAAFDAAFAAAPKGSGPHLTRAHFNFTIHRLAAARADLDAIDRYAVPDTQAMPAVTGLRGDIAFYRGDYKRALALYEQSYGMRRDLGSAFRLAYYWEKMGDDDRARSYLDKAEGSISGPQLGARGFIEMHRGLLDLNRGRWAEAEAHFRKADRLYHGYWLIERYLATTIALNGDSARAMAIYKGIAARTGRAEAMDAVAGLYRAQGDQANSRAWADRAEGAWEKRIALFPEAAYGHALDHLLAFGDPARALDIAQRNYMNRPYAEAATGLAWALLANHRPADAIRAIGPTLRSGWTSAEEHIVASQAYALLSRGAEADAERKAALAVNPHAFDGNPGMVWLEQ